MGNEINIKITASATGIDAAARDAVERAKAAVAASGISLPVRVGDTSSIDELLARLDTISDKRINLDVSAKDANAELDDIWSKLVSISAHSTDITLIAHAQQAMMDLDQVRAQLDMLKGSRVEITAKVDLDIAAAEAYRDQLIAKLDELSAKTSTPKVDADIAAAQAKLDLVNYKIQSLNDRKVQVKADADTTEAKAKLDELKTEEIKVPVKADTSSLNSLGGSFRTGLGGLSLPFEVVIPGIAAIGQLSGALGLIPAMAGAAATGLGAFLVGVTGIIDTIKAYTQAQDASLGRTATTTAQQISSANSLISASQGVTNARQAVTDAERNYQNSVISAKEAVANATQAEQNAETSSAQNIRSALQSVQQAEDSLTASKQSALRAEQNLTDARLAATRALEDAPNQVRDAQLAQQQAIVTLQQAQTAVLSAQNQQQATLTLTAQGLVSIPAPVMPAPNTQALGLAVQQAQQQVEETGLAYTRAQEDADKLTAAGVDGAKQVVSAQDQLQAAQRAQRDAVLSLQNAQQAAVQAQLSGDQQVANSKQRLADAQRALTQTEITGDEQIVRSKQAVDTAVRAQQQAIASAAAQAESAAGSMSVFNAQLARLAPNAQTAVLAFLGLSGTWHALDTDVQNHMFAGVGAEIQQVANADLPLLRSGLDATADGINGAIHLFGQWTTSAATINDTRVMFDNFGAAAHNLNGAITPILDILRNIGVVGSQFLPGLAQWFANAAQRAADFIQHAKDTGQLRQWIQTGVDAVRTLWQVLVNVAGIVKDVMGAPGDLGLLTVLLQVTSFVRWLLDNFPLLIPILEAVFLVARVQKFVEWLGATKLATLGWQGAQLLVNAAVDLGAAGLWAMLAPVGLVILGIAAVAGTAYLIYKNWDGVKGFFSDLWGGIKDIFWSSIRWIQDRFNDFINFIAGVGRSIGNIGSWMFNGIVAGAKLAVNGAIEILNLMIDGIDTILHGANYVTKFVGIPAIPDIPRIPHWQAAGGPGGGLTVLGERGPEAVILPTGSQVMPAANTQNMLAARGTSGGSGAVTVNLKLDSGGTPADQILADWVRRFVRVNGGGSVQRAFGS